jgi:hypothetical protein
LNKGAKLISNTPAADLKPVILKGRLLLAFTLPVFDLKPHLLQNVNDSNTFFPSNLGVLVWYVPPNRLDFVVCTFEEKVESHNYYFSRGLANEHLVPDSALVTFGHTVVMIKHFLS